MSIQGEMDRIAQNIANTYDVLDALGADMPAEQNSDNLAVTAGSAKAVLYKEQTLTDAQKTQARTNIGAASAVEVGKLSDQIAELPSGGSGLTQAQINALDGMFKVALYDDSKDYAGAYTTFKNAFGIEGGGSGEVEPDEPTLTTYTITSELVNVTSNNSATSVTEGAGYTATLTAVDGYTLDSVSVLMGGTDITATAYVDGVITIASVTGNVEIVASAIVKESEPELPTDGLIDFFDFRNAEPTINTTQGSTSYTGSNGGSLFAWSASVGNTSDARGSTIKRGLMYDKDGATTQTSLGQNITIIAHGYLTDRTWIGMGHTNISNINGCLCKSYPGYVNTSGSVTYMSAGDNDIPETGLEYPQYVSMIVSTDESNVYYYVNGELVVTRSANDVADFASWNNKNLLGIGNNARGVITALAIYEKTLSQAEIAEAYAFFKTLEVA